MPQVRAAARDVLRVRAVGLQQLHDGDAGLAQGKDAAAPRSSGRASGPGFARPLVFTDHHESHAASAFFPSPFEEAAILTLDGVGEWSTTALGVGRGNRIQLNRHIQFPHSLGLLYSAFTYYCGFKVNSGEYKLMGLAPYGRPALQGSRSRGICSTCEADGSFWLNMDYFNYCQGLTMTEPRVRRAVRRPAAPARSRTSSSGTWISPPASRR